MQTLFPETVPAPRWLDQVTTDGPKSTFHEGVIYRHPGSVPLLEVRGDHYEMGLQYGVLLRPEILDMLESYRKIIHWMSAQEGVPVPDLAAFWQVRAGELAGRLPERFRDELRGVAEGSGLPLATVTSFALMYDVSESRGCTGVLMRGRDGTILHGRNNDTSSTGGEEAAKNTVIVRHCPKDLNAFTHIDYPLWMGVETGYNDRGLAFSEETLHVRQPDPNGFSLPYLARMAMEECSTLEEVYAILDCYGTIGAYGCVWSSRNEGRGAVTELTPTSWAAIKMVGSLLWNFNRLYDDKLRRQQIARVNLAGYNCSREALAATFPAKLAYEVEDAIRFLRMQQGPDGTDYSWCGTQFPVCNWQGSQMVVFDPHGDGCYLGLGPYYAACQDIYHVHEDFSRPPELMMKAQPLDPIVEAAAEIENRLVGQAQKLEAFVDLAGQHVENANLHFMVARYAFILSRTDLLIEHGARAYHLQPAIAEYRLYAGMSAFANKERERAIALLDPLNFSDVYPEEELYRVELLERAWAPVDRAKSAGYAEARQAILDAHDAHAYFEANVLPLLDVLEPGTRPGRRR